MKLMGDRSMLTCDELIGNANFNNSADEGVQEGGLGLPRRGPVKRACPSANAALPSPRAWFRRRPQSPRRPVPRQSHAPRPGPSPRLRATLRGRPRTHRGAGSPWCLRRQRGLPNWCRANRGRERVFGGSWQSADPRSAAMAVDKTWTWSSLRAPKSRDQHRLPARKKGTYPGTKGGTERKTVRRKRRSRFLTIISLLLSWKAEFSVPPPQVTFRPEG